MKDYLGAEVSTVDAAFFNQTKNESFVDSSIPELIKESHRIDDACRLSTGLDEFPEEDSNWFAAPNPFIDSVELRSDDHVKKALIQIYNLNGQLVKAQNISPNNGVIKLKLNSFTPGTYIAKIKEDGKPTERITLIKR